MHGVQQNFLQYSGIIVGIFFTTGCSSLYEPTPYEHIIGPNTALSSTGALSLNILHDRDSNTYFCMAPPPDSEFNQQEGGSFDLSIVKLGGQEKAEEKVGSEEVELSGRTPSILMAREILYRVCELSNNQRLTKAETTSLFQNAVEAIRSVWAIEAGNTTVTITGKAAVTEASAPFESATTND